MSTSKAKQPSIPALDNYLPDDEDFFDPFASPTNSPNQSPKTKGGAKRNEPDGGLGIDEEVSVAKRARVPRVKLDETRLLSDKGIPALRKRAGTLKLKGKGHEFSDAARLLSFYQLWLDDLFPKAKFLDALAMVEKAGHKTTMHKARTDWINDLKPNMTDPYNDEQAEIGNAPAAQPQSSRIAPIFEKRQTKDISSVPGGGGNTVDDLFGGDLGEIYDATPKATRTIGEPDDDDIEALMAEAESSTSHPAPVARSLFGSGRPSKTGTESQHTNDSTNEEDLDALMAEAEMHTISHGSSGTRKEQGQVDLGNEDDDLDALIAEAKGVLKQNPAPLQKTQDKTSSFDDEEAAMAELDLW
ncbi:chromosome segregation in meiosis- protein [Pyricularia grisea]|nr:chromosome segregation in meiosis- protein [Pyricularia grisea]